MSNVLDSLIAAGNSFQMVGAEKLKVPMYIFYPVFAIDYSAVSVEQFRR